jgi:hypothetical protein
MKRLLLTVCTFLLAVVAVRSQDASGPIAAAATALGAGALRSIQYSGWGFDYIFGQPYDGASPWPQRSQHHGRN